MEERNDNLIQALRALAGTRGDNAAAYQEGRTSFFRFHRGATQFDGQIEYVPLKTWKLSASIPVPDAGKRFFIESKFVWFPEKGGCHRFPFPALDSRYKLHCSDDAFLMRVLANRGIVEELMRIPENMADHMKVFLKDGILTARWTFTTPGQFDNIPTRDALLLARMQFLTDHALRYGWS